MSLAANDDPSVYGLVKEFEAVMPREFYEQLDWERAEDLGGRMA
jgi:hypothetical protein